MSGSDKIDSVGAPREPDSQPVGEHLNVKVTDNNTSVFKIKRTTAPEKIIDAFCESQGKAPKSVRFLFDGSCVQLTDSLNSVSTAVKVRIPWSNANPLLE
jgi:hypothetical protein